MGIMNFLRNRAGVLIIGFIGFAIIAFLVSDAIQSGSGFIADAQSSVGEVAGEKISYKDYSEKVDQNAQQMKAQMGSLNPQMTSYVNENTWNQLVSQIILQKQVEKIGMTVGPAERYDLLFGNNPHPQIQQIFTDPQTGKFNKNNALASRKSIDQDKTGQMKAQWLTLENSIAQDKTNQKFLGLIRNSMYVNSLDAKDDFTNRNKLVNFSYVNLDYSSIPDKDVKLTDADYKAYYDENKFRFKNPSETRTIEYIIFEGKPSKADSAEAKKQIDQLAAEFKTSTNDSLFTSINADTKAAIGYQKKGELEPVLDSVMFKASKGFVYGPYIADGAYKIAKLVDLRNSPDSVTARHILLNPATEGGVDKAKAKADSLKNLIQKGAKFADLAAKFGTDGSKDKGGDLGTFGRKAMIPAFEETVFNGKPGDLKVITTQFGVHVIEIVAQKGMSQVAKVAVVDKAIAPSSQTLQSAYQKATSFITDVTTPQQFSDKAQKAGLKKLVADDVIATQGAIPGLEDPRKLIRWAFDNEKGDVSKEVFDLGSQYVVGSVLKVNEEGTLPLEAVKKQIEPSVIMEVKGKMLIEKMNKALAGSSSIQQVAQKIGKTVFPVQNVVFANPVIPGVSQENKVVGTVFGSQPNKLSKPVAGDRGVYVFVVNGFVNPSTPINIVKQKEQLIQTLVQQADGAVFQVLKDNAKVKDNRAKFL